MLAYPEPDAKNLSGLPKVGCDIRHMQLAIFLGVAL